MSLLCDENYAQFVLKKLQNKSSNLNNLQVFKKFLVDSNVDDKWMEIRRNP